MPLDIFTLREGLTATLRDALRALGIEDGPVSLERPKDPSHGDLAIPTAMGLAKRLKRPPLEIAREILGRCRWDPAFVASAELAPPGFINLRLQPEVLQSVLGSALKKDREYGHSLQAKGERVLLEFVSANPTGPLNVVSARAAALGDSIGNLLAAAGAEVSREYYVNDAGVQARLFGESLLAAVSRVKGVPADAPEGGYQGAYMEDLAREYIGLFEGPGRTPPQDPGAWGMERVLGWHQASLKGYEVEFDRWFSERKELHESGAVDSTIERLKKEGLTYEKEGALWFKVSEFGAPKDEVLVKGDGKPAYFTPDIAYHLDKYARGYDRILDILGPDHHGHIQRLKAAMTALRLPVEKLTVLVAQQVNLLEGGEKVKMSKREGKFVKMDDLLSEVGKDAARYFFVMRSANTHLDFDLEVARKRTDENPVFYVQYAHARIHSLLRKCAERGLHPVKEDREFGSLREPEALLLLKGILEYPEWVAESGKAYEPHRIVAFLQGLAADFHLFYTKHRILDADPPVARARLGLVLGVATVLRNALGLLGVSAPEQM